MPLEMMYITNRPEVARIAQRYTVQRIWVDLETRGKQERQRGMNTVQSTHTMADVSRIREALTTAELIVRVNPLFDESGAEIDEAIARGAQIVMLPMYSTLDEAKRFVDLVAGRAKTMLLLETLGAERCAGAAAALPGVDEMHIGLNDLHLQHGCTFMFELLSDGTVERLCDAIRVSGKPYGFGGVARLDEGLLPARHIIAEHVRLGSTRAILSRSFYDAWLENDLEEIERVFEYGMREIREYEQRLAHKPPAYFAENQRMVRDEVAAIVKRKAAALEKS